MREVASALKMNIGTVRYHLFILSLNHRIVSVSADEKYLRYFTNSGTYSKESQIVISLMRREGINRVLTALIESPCLSNRELSQRSGIQESAVSRYMKELAEKGIVIKEKGAGGATSFSVVDGYKAYIQSAMRRIGSP
jgi:predicted transcriptional regulator